MNIKCIIGLGNPGDKYAKNRHNLGFMVVDEVARRYAAKFRPGNGDYYYTKIKFENGLNAYMVKPTTFMNRSGIAVLQVAETYDLVPEEILVVWDDFELPLGQIRIRKKGSGGSHNGMNDVIQMLESDRIPRMRLGIGKANEEFEAVDFVLSNFEESELKMLEKLQLLI